MDGPLGRERMEGCVHFFNASDKVRLVLDFSVVRKLLRKRRRSEVVENENGGEGEQRRELTVLLRIAEAEVDDWLRVLDVVRPQLLMKGGHSPMTSMGFGPSCLHPLIPVSLSAFGGLPPWGEAM